MKKKKKETPRKPYEEPKLKIYGDLKKITKGVGAADREDGAGPKTWNKGCP